MRITKTNPYLSLVNEYIIDSPAPMNINYFYNLGSLLGLNLVVLIITGVTLAMHYIPDVSLAFQASEHIVRDVNLGWAIRYTHANAVSMFFIMVYIHIGKALYYGSYRAPRRLLWIVGVIIFIVMMAKLLAKMYLLIFKGIFINLTNESFIYNINIFDFSLKFNSTSIPLAFIAPRIRANKRIGPHS
jgi:quinol-cytochrome oxidoreductase complex cytochrome b subunit